MQAEDVNRIMDETEQLMKDAVEHLRYELAKVSTGKASTSLVKDISINYYGSPAPMNQVANISTSDARTLVIQPWEKPMLSVIEKAIFEANLGVTPMNDGDLIRIIIPPLTEERRRDLVKQVKKLGEDAKVSLRNARHKALDVIKKAVKDGYPEDAGKRRENEVKDLIDKYTKKVENLIEIKEEDVMTV